MSSTYIRSGIVCSSVALLFFASNALASYSLGVNASLDHVSYVYSEAANLSIDIENFGASTFIVDDYGRYPQNRIEILLKRRNSGAGEILDMVKGNPFGDVMIMPKEKENVKVNLARWFQLTEGRYFAQIVVRRGDETAMSRLLTFEVVRGIEIGSATRPLPQYDTVSRTYTLLYWPREHVEEFYMRVLENPPGNVIGLVYLGNIVRVDDPKIEFDDDAATLKITHQATRDYFIRTTVRSTRDELSILGREQLLDPKAAPVISDLVGRASLRDREKAGDLEEEFVRRRRKDDSGDKR